MTDTDKILKAAANIIARAALGLFVVDQHRWSNRPCMTCKQITEMLGEPFGCYEYQQKS